MAHPYEAELETFLAARKVVVRGPEAARAPGGPRGSTSSKPSSAGTCTGGVGSMDGSDRRSSKASSCSCRCSTTTRRCIARSVRREVPTPRTRQPGEPKPLAPLDTLLESGKVLALNFPVGMNPGLARILGVMLKLDFQRAVLQRIPQITAQPERIWRDLLFVCDEYHAFATVGETDPTGDERTFALSRQARLIPIVATQSISSLRSALPGDESWRTLLQCFRTKVFLATSDEFTARNAAELCGRRDRLKAHYSVSESGRDAHISLLTGRPTSATAVAQREQELRAASRVHLCAARVHAAPERAGHRAAVRRHQPAAAAVLLPEAALPGRADQLLRSPGARRDMSSLDRILPFLKPIEDLLRRSGDHRGHGERRRAPRVRRARGDASNAFRTGRWKSGT